MEVVGVAEGVLDGFEVVGVWEGVFDGFDEVGVCDGEWEGLEDVGATEGTFPPGVGDLEGVTLGKLVGEVVGKQVKIGPPFV